MGLCVSSNPNPPVFFPHVGEVVIFEQIAEGGYSVVFKAAGKSSSAYAVKRMICVEVCQLYRHKNNSILSCFNDVLPLGRAIGDGET